MPIFVSAGGVNALAGVLLFGKLRARMDDATV